MRRRKKWTMCPHLLMFNWIWYSAVTHALRGKKPKYRIAGDIRCWHNDSNYYFLFNSQLRTEQFLKHNANTLRDTVEGEYSVCAPKSSRKLILIMAFLLTALVVNGTRSSTSNTIRSLERWLPCLAKEKRCRLYKRRTVPTIMSQRQNIFDENHFT